MLAFQQNQHKGLIPMPLLGGGQRQTFCVKGAANLEKKKKAKRAMCSTPNSFHVSKELRRADEGIGISNLKVLAGHQHTRK